MPSRSPLHRSSGLCVGMAVALTVLLSSGANAPSIASVAVQGRASPIPAAVTIGLITPRDYAVIPPGSPLLLSIGGGPLSSVQYSLDGGSLANLSSPYLIDTGSWSTGTHFVRVVAWSAGYAAASRTFTIHVDPASTWPPDNTPMDIVLIGFDVNASAVADRVISQYIAPTPLTSSPSSFYNFDLRFPVSIRKAPAAYHQGLLAALRGNATYTDTLQARLNLTALMDQRTDGIPRDIFDPLVGYQIRSGWLEAYVAAHPPLPPPANRGFTFYMMNLTALDNPGNGTDHWFVRRTPDPDTGVDENWWRLEWDNDLNTPVGYPMGIFGGPNRTVFVDPTAYQWYLDWAYIWRDGGNGRAPHSLEYEEIPPADRDVYLAEIVNDLVAGLGSVLPWAPPQDLAVELRTYVLVASANYTLDDLRWVYSDQVLRAHLQQSFVPQKSWVVNTTFARIDDYPGLKAVVDSNTTSTAGRGEINGTNVWNYLLSNRSLYLTPRPGVFAVLSVALIYDNRTMAVDGKPFTGLGGQGVTVIVMPTDRLFYSNGTRQKGITSLLAHELGHSLGYDHQFGPHYRADFVDGNMGYFLNEISYGTFWTDAMYRVLATAKLAEILVRLSTRQPINLREEFGTFYREYAGLNLSGSYFVLYHLEGLLDDAVPPVADAGMDRTVEHDVPLLLDGSNSTDNYRVVNYSWDFGDGTSAWSWDPTLETSWRYGGAYEVTLTVYDGAGNQASATVVVRVLGPSPPAPPTNWAIVAGIGIGVVAVAAAAVLVLFRRRRSPPSPPPG